MLKAKAFFHGFYGHLILMLLLTTFAGVVLTDDLVARGALYWDNIEFYSFFWNQMDSLNRFGGLAWWFPSNQFGWPAYYYSILGDISTITPAFMSLGFFSWVTGVFGLRPDSFYGIYVFYFAYLVPFMVSLGAYAVARQLLRTRAALAFVLILSAFSPGVILNVSDLGFLEPLAYSLYFFAAWIYFLKNPHRSASFWLLALSSCVLALSLGYPFILFNALFLPVVLILTSFVPLKCWPQVKAALKSRSWKEWGIFAFVSFLCALPSLLTFTQTGDLIRSKIGQEFYDYRDLAMGNPLEAVAVSIPQFGFEWMNGLWTLLPGAQGSHISSIYLGLLCFPMVFAALMYSSRVVRFRMLFALVFFVGLVTLSSYSPFFSLILRVVRPFQSNNHYSDLLFRAGTYQLYIAFAALGFDLLTSSRPSKIKYALPWLSLLNLVACIAVYVVTFREAVLGNVSFALTLVFSGFFFVALFWISRSRKVSRYAVSALLLLSLVELATFNFIHMRKTVEKSHRVLVREESVLPNMVGLYPKGDYADHLLNSRPLIALQKGQFPFGSLERFKLFTSAHVSVGANLDEQIAYEKNLFQAGPQNYRSLNLDSSATELNSMQSFLASGSNTEATVASGDVQILFLSYNQMKLKVSSSRPALLMILDGYSPYWSATVNDEPVEIARALFNFKALAVPAGVSEVELKFSPRGIAAALFLAYLVLFSVLGMCLYFMKKQKQ